jgi:hypothetical protein
MSAPLSKHEFLDYLDMYQKSEDNPTHKYADQYGTYDVWEIGTGTVSAVTEYAKPGKVLYYYDRSMPT